MIDTRWSDTLLDTMRLAGDSVADGAIARIVAQGQVDAVNRVMRTLVENDDFPTADLPPAVDEFLEATRSLPAWADMARVQRGAHLFARYGPEIVLMLFGASLPLLYAAHPGCEVLAATRHMTHNVHRRIIETGQFVIDVTAPNAWEPEGRGVLTTQKVRLMHAAIRYYLTRHDGWQGHWQPEWGVPICQEDLAGTLLSFSVTVCQSLERSRITLTAEQKESYLHLWKVIGYVMGIDERLLPADYPDAESLLDRWIARNHRPNATSQALMKAMVDFWYRRVPGRTFDSVTSNWCRLWIGDELADTLEVPPFRWTLALNRLQMQVWKYEDRFADSVVPYQVFTRYWTRQLMKALLVIERGGRRPAFRIPEALQHQWGL